MYRFWAVLLAIFLAAPAIADSPSYNFIQAGYQSIELDLGAGSDVDGDGYGLGVSFEIADNIFGFASFVTSDFDFGVELNQLQAGLGYRLGLTDNTDVFASLAYVYVEVEAGFFGSADDSGYGATIGVRSNVSDLIELFGEVAYVDLGGGSDGTAIGGGIWFNLTDNFALGLGAAFDDDVTSYGASARFYFGM